jgi:prefoldin subunit 5
MSDTATEVTQENGRAPDLSARIEARLEELRAELQEGERRLAELDAERVRIRDTMLRIDGAMMALNELNGPPPEPG